MSFVAGTDEIGTGKFNYTNVYVMTENPETIKALNALSFAAETEMADMKYDIIHLLYS